jgi:hypothetical protein
LQIKQKEIEIEQIEQTKVGIEEEDSDAYSLFVYAMRSQVTKDYYLRRLKIFFNHINLLPVLRKLVFQKFTPYFTGHIYSSEYKNNE